MDHGLTFFACHNSPSCRSVFLRFTPALFDVVSLDEAKVRSTSHIDTSTSLPAAANEVALEDEDARHVSGPGIVVVRPSPSP